MKKQLVLHICCAPDQAWVINTLKEEYHLHCFFCNPNIHPEDEYQKRLKESEKVAKLYAMPFSADPYEPDAWHRAIKGLEHTPEGGERCEQCFLLRLRRTAQFCKEKGFTQFTTTMSISPHKRIEMLNKTGKQAAQEYGVTYYEFNFKKKNGFLNSIALSKELDLYRQDYCGCLLSRNERDERNRKV
jgi:predicted adenine nucleotide alpha hydrolase (AANH) superfamily ATPase